MKKSEPDTLQSDAVELYDLLTGMAQGLEQLYQCLRRQQAAVIKWNLEDFLSTVEDEKRLARENLDREEARKALVERIMAGSFQENSPVSLRELASHLEPQWQERFRELAARIKSASGSVAEMKKQNEFLITRARETVNDQLKLLLELARLNRNTYEESGKKSRKANLHKVLDRRV
ncbi:MAG: flagellar export chaperone FlgN [Gemmatimonadota bacterium]|nr:flagellar export chaperone FlgN [Gemmatimonadota bacterium]